jgi:LAGLIDADG endonuclease
MGYRGSKSEIQCPQPKEIFVKEQRVDGSYFGLLSSFLPIFLYKAGCSISKLRCILMGCESSYQIKIPSKQLKSRYYNSTLITKPIATRIDPWFVTGFTDAEGCFTIKTQYNPNLKTKWRIRPVFSITLNNKDLPLLKIIQNYLKVGNISQSSNMVIYAVDSIRDVDVIINHFDKYSLITHKISDYFIFKRCFYLIKQKEHLTDKGLLKIMSLKGSLNLGLPDNIKNVFPNIKIKERTKYEFKGIPSSFWISGFISGDGSFHIVFRSTGSVFLRFSVHLHIRDLEVLEGIVTYLKGNLSKKIILSENSANLQMTKYSDIIYIIIPFFNNYPILGMKSLDFEDFKKVSKIIETKEYLTKPSMYNEIVKIKSGMNLNRK